MMTGTRGGGVIFFNVLPGDKMDPRFSAWLQSMAGKQCSWHAMSLMSVEASRVGDLTASASTDDNAAPLRAEA